VKRQTVFKAVGTLLIAVGVLGVMTVADDLRHLGEVFGVAAVLVSGLAFVGASLDVLSTYLALQWLPAALAVGLAVGVALDATPAAVTLGFFAGLILAFILRRRASTKGLAPSPHHLDS
jgi:integral membrane sensor domain MASE1